MDMERADMLVDILRHLPPRSIAASRCVCTAWRAVVDDHRLLRADLLPLSLDAVVYDTTVLDSTGVFSRRPTSRNMTSALDYLDVESPLEKNDWWPSPMLDHCNGLLLLDDIMVLNPATRQWVKLPPPPHYWPTLSGCPRCVRDRYLVYDPTVSPHYQVFLIPRIPVEKVNHERCYDYESVSVMDWPPSPYVISVFSSKTGCWEERPYVREGDAAGIVAALKLPGMRATIWFYSAYWRGALYVHWEYAFLLRINLSNDKYQVLKLPGGNNQARRIGKSKNGVYCSLLHRGCICEVWFLDESFGQMNWVLKNEINLEPVETKFPDARGPWDVQSFDEMEWLLDNNDANFKVKDESNKALVQDDFEWDSDDENAVSTADWPRERCGFGSLFYQCLGFHPYKEIVLFHGGSNKVVAYHFNSSKVRHLGKMWIYHEEIEASFAYTPCWTKDLPGSS